MRRLIYSIRSHYGYSAKEASGVFFLFLFMAFALATPFGYRLWLSRSANVQSVEDSLVFSLVQVSQPQSLDTLHWKRPARTLPVPLSPVPFDPNTVTVAELISMGVPQKLSERWDKYRKGGGTFRKSEDIRKLFGMTDAVYTSLAPYAAFSSTVVQNRKSVDSLATAAYRTTRPARYIIELNTADTALLVSLPRVGSKSAQRIIEYRLKLGGYRSLEQLKEVYGVDSAMYSVLKRELTLDTMLVIKLPINTVDLTTLANHPYIGGKRRAGILINYRTAKGPLRSLADVEKSKAVDPAYLEKLAPYLLFDMP